MKQIQIIRVGSLLLYVSKINIIEITNKVLQSYFHNKLGNKPFQQYYERQYL